jgi:hypothetical protein
VAQIVHLPAPRPSKRRQLARWVISGGGSWWVTRLAAPVLFTGMPGLAIFVLTRPEYRAAIEAQLPILALGPINLLLVVVSLTLLPILLKAAWAVIEDWARPEGEYTREDVVFLMDRLQRIVGMKLSRFSEAIVSGQRPRGHLSSVLKPEVQIKSLLGVVHEFFSSMDAHTQFRVGLMRVIDGKPKGWIHFLPESHVPRSGPEELSAPTSTIMRCVEAKSIVIVDDIKKELERRSKDDRRFIKANSPVADGSQLCFPVIDHSSRQVVFVITIAGNRTACLMESRADMYSWVLHIVSSRIQLEFCVDQLNGRGI